MHTTDRRAHAGGRHRRVDVGTALITLAVVALAAIGGTGTAPSSDAAPPPPGRFHHGAAGSARNGVGGSIAASSTMPSWPGTGTDGNGGPFAFVGAHYGSLWGIAAGPNNSVGVGYCVMEDLTGAGTVTLRPDPPQWDADETARAAALMAGFGGDRVVPYGIDASGPYDVATGEWHHPALLGGGEYTRRRHIAVNFGVKMFVEDVSPSGAVAGRKLARDSAVAHGSGSDFNALRNGYEVAKHLAAVADVQHAVGGIALHTTWDTPDGIAPSTPGTYPITARVTDSTGKPVGFVPVVQLSDIGIGSNRSSAATAVVRTDDKSPDDRARWNAAAATGWPTLEMGGRFASDDRFGLPTEPRSADVTDESGIARFDVTITRSSWELAFHAQAPTANVDLYAGTGVQGQITWSGPPQSASTHQVVEGLSRFVIRKVLDAPDIQGDRNMSGFRFAVVPADIGAPPGTSGDPPDAVATATTGADGRTATIELPPGPYRIVETGRPAWAEGLGDDGPVGIDLAPGTTAAPATEVTYTNTVPTASITTSATAVDGSKFLRDTVDPDGRSDETTVVVVDRITHTGLVAGTAYLARGELLVDSCDHEHTRWCDDPIATAETHFRPEAPTGTIEVRFTVPADAARGHSLVALQRMLVGERVVAEHRDRDDPAQTVHYPTLSSQLLRVPGRPSGDQIVDHVAYAGVRPGLTYRMETTLQERSPDGACTPTGQMTAVDFVADHSSGTVEMRGLTLPHAGVFVAFDRLLTGGTPIATHEDCDDAAQTLVKIAEVPAPSTTTPGSVPTTTTPADTPTVPTTTPARAPSPPTSPPSAPSPPPPAPPSIARTGNADVASTLGGGLALTLLGSGALMMAKRRQNPSAGGDG
jgi:hypothetical protein